MESTDVLGKSAATGTNPGECPDPYPEACHAFFNHGQNGSTDSFFATLQEVEAFLAQLGHEDQADDAAMPDG
jgi:hypothetical protein